MTAKPRKSENMKSRDAGTLAGLAAGDRARSSVTMKRGPGRPPRQEERARLVVLLPPDLKARLQHLAVDERRELSAIVAEALGYYLDRREAK